MSRGEQVGRRVGIWNQGGCEADTAAWGSRDVRLKGSECERISRDIHIARPNGWKPAPWEHRASRQRGLDLPHKAGLMCVVGPQSAIAEAAETALCPLTHPRPWEEAQGPPPCPQTSHFPNGPHTLRVYPWLYPIKNLPSCFQRCQGLPT